VRVFAICLGVLALAGTVILVVADASSSNSNAMGPLAFLCCILAVILMIILGVTFGGRGRARASEPLEPEPSDYEPSASEPSASEPAPAPEPALEHEPVPEPEPSEPDR
jgi:hypothetical protein